MLLEMGLENDRVWPSRAVRPSRCRSASAGSAVFSAAPLRAVAHRRHPLAGRRDPRSSRTGAATPAALDHLLQALALRVPRRLVATSCSVESAVGSGMHRLEVDIAQLLLPPAVRGRLRQLEVSAAAVAPPAAPRLAARAFVAARRTCRGSSRGAWPSPRTACQPVQVAHGERAARHLRNLLAQRHHLVLGEAAAQRPDDAHLLRLASCRRGRAAAAADGLLDGALPRPTPALSGSSASLAAPPLTPGPRRRHRLQSPWAGPSPSRCCCCCSSRFYAVAEYVAGARCAAGVVALRCPGGTLDPRAPHLDSMKSGVLMQECIVFKVAGSEVAAQTAARVAITTITCSTVRAIRFSTRRCDVSRPWPPASLRCEGRRVAHGDDYALTLRAYKLGGLG